MRSKDGIHLTRAIREVSKIPIVILSTLIEQPDGVMNLDLSADDPTEALRGSDFALSRYRPRIQPVDGHDINPSTLRRQILCAQPRPPV